MTNQQIATHTRCMLCLAHKVDFPLYVHSWYHFPSQMSADWRWQIVIESESDLLSRAKHKRRNKRTLRSSSVFLVRCMAVCLRLRIVNYTYCVAAAPRRPLCHYTLVVASQLAQFLLVWLCLIASRVVHLAKHCGATILIASEKNKNTYIIFTDNDKPAF